MPGEQLLASRLVDVNALAGQGRVQVPAGFQELTLKLPIERVVGGKLFAGDTVGVLLSFKADDKSNLPDQTQLTFHKVLVTAVQDASGAISDDGDSSSEDSTSSLNANKSTTKDGYLVTLARSSEDVQKVVFAAEFGTVYLSKEPSEATEDTNPAVLDRGRCIQMSRFILITADQEFERKVRSATAGMSGSFSGSKPTTFPKGLGTFWISCWANLRRC